MRRKVRASSCIRSSAAEPPSAAHPAQAAGLAHGTPSDGADPALAGPTRPAPAELLALLAVLAAALWLRLGDFNEPFGGYAWSHLSSRLALQGRNFAENGYAVTRFAPATDPVPPADGLWQTYVNHPPLLSLVLSASSVTEVLTVLVVINDE